MDLKLFPKKQKKEKCKKRCVRDKVEEAFVALESVKNDAADVLCDITLEEVEDECRQEHKRKAR